MDILKNYLGEALDIGVSGGKEYRIPFGKLVKGTVNKAQSTVTSDSLSNMVVMTDAFVMPYVGAVLKFSLPAGYNGIVYYGSPEGRTGVNTNVSKYSSPELSDGETFTFPVNSSPTYVLEHYYRIGFIKDGITLSEVEELIENGEIKVTCDREKEGVVEMNYDIIKDAEVLSWNMSYEDNIAIAAESRNPIIVHISDLHGDAIRYQRAIELAERLGAVLVNTGDHVPQCARDGFYWPYYLVKDKSLLSIVAEGNHDAVGIYQTNFDAQAYTDLAAKYGYSRVGAYYYVDDDVNMIRHICLNSCDYETTDTQNEKINRISTRQQLWYAQALLGTPEGYGVVVSLHQAVGVNKSDEDYAEFVSERGRLSAGIVTYGGADVINITDSFIIGTPITVNGTVVDFSEKNEGAEFVMYLNGHCHADYIGHIANAQLTQLQCNIGTGNNLDGHWFTNDYITHNQGIGKNQDLVNVYVINRDAGTVFVARVGTDMSTLGHERKKMTIPYK